MERRRRVALGIVLIALGAALAVVAFFVEGLIECADPGGCRVKQLVSGPVLAAGILLSGVGMVVLATPVPRVLHLI